MYRPTDSGARPGQPYAPDGAPLESTHFASPVYGMVEPAIAGSSPRLHPATARPAAARLVSHVRHSSLEVAHARRSPSPRASLPTPATASFRPSDRSLPERAVAAETITTAFVDFILYCNPNFPLDVDTTTLRTNFQNPPKSDSKDFDTFRLFELLKKFDAKEIKTWAQLALDLGVEAPDTSKGQSVQKVQQYSVRLKRWMRAMHIDAFFEYLMGKPHVYFTEIPHPSEPYSSNGRDGVAAEEDLAIRALDPAFRPKRGRRRNSEVDQDEAPESAHPSKLARGPDHAAYPLQSALPLSAAPASAHPDSYHDPWAAASAVTPHSLAPWSSRSAAPLSAVTGPTLSNLRWQASQTPATPHPMTATSPCMSAHIDAALDNELKSAVTPSGKRRRKHGPAVSSAWPSANAPGAKPRGRPPANRNLQDGPYNTFPVDPANEKASPFPHLPTPLSGDKQVSFDPPDLTPPVTSAHSEGRPGRLSLQVPVHTGGPVRLATPPRVLVNGETNDSDSRSGEDVASQPSRTSHNTDHGTTYRAVAQRRLPGISSDVFKRTLASDLLRADMVGRRQRLTGDEAKRLADAATERLGLPRDDTDDPRDDIARLTAASWFGLGGQLNVPPGPATGHWKRITVTRFRLNADGYEEIAPDPVTAEQHVREVFDLHWSASCGSCMGTFEMKGLTLGGSHGGGGDGSVSRNGPPPWSKESLHDFVLRKAVDVARHLPEEGRLEEAMRDVARATASTRPGPGEETLDWRGEYRALEFAVHVARGQLEREKQLMLERVVDALL